MLSEAAGAAKPGPAGCRLVVPACSPPGGHTVTLHPGTEGGREEGEEQEGETRDERETGQDSDGTRGRTCWRAPVSGVVVELQRSDDVSLIRERKDKKLLI